MRNPFGVYRVNGILAPSPTILQGSATRNEGEKETRDQQQGGIILLEWKGQGQAFALFMDTSHWSVLHLETQAILFIREYEATHKQYFMTRWYFL
jgi:hypothetical protein